MTSSISDLQEYIAILNRLDSNATDGPWSYENSHIYQRKTGKLIIMCERTEDYSLEAKSQWVEGNPNAELISFLRNHLKGICEVLLAADQLRNACGIEQIREAMSNFDAKISENIVPFLDHDD